MNDSISALIWTVSTLLLGYLVLLLLKRADTYLNDQSSKRKPEAPPRPEYKPEFVNLKFPDGTEGKLDETQYHRNFRWEHEHYADILWTIPMKELFLLITQDYTNWGRERHIPSSRNHLFRKTRYTHKVLGITIDEECTSHRSEEIYSSSLSLSDRQTGFVVAQAKCWKDVVYSKKLRRIENIEECRRKRILLENQQKEATMITQYLENKDKA